MVKAKVTKGKKSKAVKSGKGKMKNKVLMAGGAKFGGGKSSRPKLEATSVGLSACALKYAVALAEPFSPSARGACLPCYPSEPSQKVTGYIRFTAAAGSGGYGFCAFTPCLANDAVIAFHTGSGFTGVDASQILTANSSLAGGVTTVNCSNLPYTSAQLRSTSGNGTVYGRIVSFGYRITYVGTLLNESGVYHLASSATHGNITATAATTSDASSFINTVVCGITKESCEARVYPVASEEAQYTSANSADDNTTIMVHPYSGGDSAITGVFNFTPAGGVATGVPVAIVHFGGVQGAQYLIEVVQHVEYIGRLTGSAASPNVSDQRGFEIVTAAAAKLPLKQEASPHAKPMALMKSAIGEVLQALKPVAIKALGAAFSALLL